MEAIEERYEPLEDSLDDRDTVKGLKGLAVFLARVDYIYRGLNDIQV